MAKYGIMVDVKFLMRLGAYIMITKQAFDEYKAFREQAGCPFCKRDDVPFGDGLYWCALDEKLNPIQEAIMSSFTRKLFPMKMTEENIRSEALKRPPTCYAWHCEGCGRYWIDSDTGMVLDNVFPPSAPDNLPTDGVSPSEAMGLLAEKAYSFFECDYKSSSRFESLVEMYSTFRVEADVATLNGYDRIQEIEKPLIQARDKLNEYVFDTVKSCLKKMFPNRSYYQIEAQKLWEDMDEYSNTLAKLFFEKMAIGFVPDLFYLLKKNCSNYMCINYPREAHFCLDNPDNADGWWNELYGRSVSVAVDCMGALGLNIPVVDMEKIVYGPVSAGDGAIAIKNVVFGGVTLGDGSMYFEDYHGNDFHGQTVVHKETLTANSFSAEAVEAMKKIAEATALTQEQKDALIDLIKDAKQAHEKDNGGEKESCKKAFRFFLSGAGEVVKETLKTVLPSLILTFFGLTK